MDPRIAVVVPTIGRRHNLQRLFSSLDKQTLRPTRVLVVDQGADPTVKSVTLEWGFSYVHTSPGVSRARNIGAALVLGEVDIITFVDDDIWYNDRALELAARIVLLENCVVSARLLQPTGTGRMWDRGTRRGLSKRTVWRGALETGLYMSVATWSDLGGFDEKLGLGAATPWQSGEGTELLIRAMNRGHTVVYAPEVVLFEDDPVPNDQRDAVARSLAYGRGTGRVYQIHYSFPEQAWFVARSLMRVMLSALHGARAIAIANAALRGRLEGLGLLATRRDAHDRKI